MNEEVPVVGASGASLEERIFQLLLLLDHQLKKVVAVVGASWASLEEWIFYLLLLLDHQMK
jgi:hypothetical protein